MTSVDSLLYKLLADRTMQDASWFSKIAESIFRQHILVASHKKFLITEIEFYLFSTQLVQRVSGLETNLQSLSSQFGTHPDPYVHQHSQQLNTCGEWYFHRESSASKSFTLKGLDLTFGEIGNPFYRTGLATQGYGGILIRGLLDLESKTQIEGPSNSVNAILDAYKVESVKELKPLLLTNPLLCYAKPVLGNGPQSSQNTATSIYVGRRYGIKTGNTNSHRLYHTAPYRYRIYPTSKTKERSELKLWKT